MEFPDAGSHCSFSECRQLDFLPYTCDACNRKYCQEHRTYTAHRCVNAANKDQRAIQCPMCNTPIKVKVGEDPNIKVENHLRRGCRSSGEVAKMNACDFAGCKQKEFIPITCKLCHQNFCLKHRFESDHSCKGARGSHKSQDSTKKASNPQPKKQERPGPSQVSLPFTERKEKGNEAPINIIATHLETF
eukprot:TRINITY_DN5178_c0_g1_i3.p1 TRINITY_DN5178_c0_g1~~TRINITY_DN5178_c0_g1_i3.p1  ORF type:complete len:189 (+),score=24.55 TRINITY_DN5178_c0_g1_i3:51-617(+)